MLLAFGAIAGRVVQVQGLAADRYDEIGENQRVRKVVLPAERGSIFDRNGHDLALTVRQSSVVANPRLVDDPLGAAAALAPVLHMDPVDLQTRLTREKSFVYIARTVADDVAARVRALALPGVELVPEPARFLPAGVLAAPVLGRVGTDNTGLSGIERQFDTALAGTAGSMVVERDPRGREIAGGIRRLEAADRGEDLVLTVDRAIQYQAERSLASAIQRFRAKGGMVIVLETRTGEVLALANMVTPPNGGPPVPATKNTALTDVFEPGSMNKLITIAGALEDGIVRPADTLMVPSTIRVADHVFSEHEPHPVAQWSVTDVMANSSNVGTIMIGQRLGKNRIDNYLRAFGFGAKTGLGFPGESRGILLDPAKWSGTSIGTVPIGQGLAVTAMQMVTAFNAVANGGQFVAPKLVKATVDARGGRHPAPSAEPRRVVSVRTASELTAMLGEVVRVGTGTNAAIDGYTVAGKTGTARKPLEGVRGYKAGAYVSSFAGFVPAEDPALSAIVILDEPTPIYGGIVAAPVFAEVAGYALRQLRVPPPARIPTVTVAVPQASPDSARSVGEVGDRKAPAGTIPSSSVPSSTP